MIYALLAALVAIGVELWMAIQQLSELKGAVGMMAAMTADAMAAFDGYENRDEYMHGLIEKIERMEQEREKEQKV